MIIVCWDGHVRSTADPADRTAEVAAAPSLQGRHPIERGPAASSGHPVGRGLSRRLRSTACTRYAAVVAWPLVTAGETAEQVATAQGDLAAVTAHAEHLQRALVSSRQIGMAMGILMERHRLTQEQAFERLRDLSQRRNVKLRDVADQIIYTGDTHQPPD